MKLKDLIEGLTIITKTQPDADLDIHNDALYVGAIRPDMAPADAGRLEELGWDEDEDSWSLTT